jgi:hypothetical protein
MWLELSGKSLIDNMAVRVFFLVFDVFSFFILKSIKFSC